MKQISVRFITTLVMLMLLSTSCMMNASIQSLDSALPDSGNVKISRKIYLDTTQLTISEGSAAIINVAVSEKMDKDIQVNVSLNDPAGRFQAVASTLTIPAQTLSRPIVLQTIDDNIYQGLQVVDLAISSTEATLTADPNSLTINIQDNDLPPVIQIADAVANENSGTIDFTVTTNRVSILTSTFDYSSQNGTALAGSDYTAVSAGTLSIPAGQTSAALHIPLINDTVSEPNETFSLNFSNASNSSLGVTSSTGTIVDDDAVPLVTFHVASQSVNENVGSVQVQLDLDSVSSQTVSVPFTLSGTASGSDYSLTTSSPVTIPAGQTSVNVSLSIVNDALNESNETIILSMGAPTNAALGAVTSHTITVLDNDSQPSVSLSSTSQSVNENAGSASVNLVLSAVSGQDVIVPITLSGTATGGSDDYLLTSSTTMTIPAGQTTVAIDFNIINDSAVESNETIIVTLGAPTNATLGATTSHTITIVDDDVYISISDVTVLENAGTAVLTISINKTTINNVSVNYATSNGTAIAGTNYTTTSGTATINAGSTSTTISVPILDTAGVCEGNRTFNVDLTAAVNGTIQDNLGLGTIQEDDLPAVSVGNVTVKEGFIAAVPVSLNQACNMNVTVSYTMADGTATAASGDYAGVSGTFTVPAGKTTSYLGVTIFDDSTVEASENLTLTILSPVNATLGTTTSTITITDNDVTLAAVSDVNYISAGPRVICAARNGAAYCWGANGNGEFGNGTNTPSYYPIPVTGLSSGVTKLVSGGYYYPDVRSASRTCAIVSGAAKCWGYQSMGELGNNGGGSSLTPVDVVGLTSDVTDIDTSDIGYGGFTCAVHNGAAKCWGNNSNGQLGNGTTTVSPVPVTVSGLSSGVVSIAVGENHACAALSDGTVKCWGNNAQGQFGDGTTTSSTVPVTVSGIASGATKVTAGFRHTCALVSGGVKCWGSNGHGQLGNGTTIASLTPVDATGMTSGVVDLSASGDGVGGLSLTCAVTSAGAVKCWGNNNYGQLGDGTTTSKTVATQVTGLTSGFTQVSVSVGTVCALNNLGKSYCWGDYILGQLSNNMGAFLFDPRDTNTMSSQVSAVSVGSYYSCAVKNGSAYCWGANGSGQLGNGNNTLQGSPVQVSGLTSGVTQIATDSDNYYSNRHACAIHNGAVKCWGDNSNGQLGNGTTGGTSNVPVQVSGLTSGAVSVAVSLWHSCAVMNTGSVKCWGNNSHGQLGNNSTVNSNVPVDVIGVTSATLVSVATRYSCATDAGALKCWGLNSSGQLGDGTTTDRMSPVTVTGVTSGVTSVATMSYDTSNSFTCAVVNGAAKCWGYGYNGRLGSAVGSSTVPTQVTGFSSGVSKVSLNVAGGCLLTTEGAVHCWGENNSLLMSPTLSFFFSVTPVASIGLSAGIQDMSTGGAGLCAVTASGSLKCLGNYLNVGAGITATYSVSPVEILFP